MFSRLLYYHWDGFAGCPELLGRIFSLRSSGGAFFFNCEQRAFLFIARSHLQIQVFPEWACGCCRGS